MIRAFVALPLPSEVVDALGRMGRELRELDLEGRFVKPASIHLTLKFLGDIEESQVELVAQAMRRSCESLVAFEVRLSGLGGFPNLGRPRVVWVGMDAPEELYSLQGRLDRELAKLGFQPESRSFKPHLTLVRLKSRRGVDALEEFCRQRERQLRKVAFTLGQAVLYRSILKPQGAEYSRLAEARLG